MKKLYYIVLRMQENP